MLSDARRHATPFNGGNPRTGVAQERTISLWTNANDQVEKVSIISYLVLKPVSVHFLLVIVCTTAPN
ncbi:hypothetical protein [Nostoc sp. NIES-3756]|uniref:hypothetical protein n=1 Tax=Nostoc sp. NIES-3756 TaxID=1751286 RepID=UPI000AE79DFF|nr:hypothetical protein [Nostoc sp. NIES-3756]